jgi:hypothetical protein
MHECTHAQQQIHSFFHSFIHSCIHSFIHSPVEIKHGTSLQYSLIMACQFKSRIHSTYVSVINIYEPDPGKTKSVTHARILLVRVAFTDGCCGSLFGYRFASGKLKSVMGKCLMCVCHCADNWKNLTPDHSVPSMLTATVGIFTVIQVLKSFTIILYR